jgi:(p)ppGpp synthase/HD superfamily hydrolase
MQSLAFKAMAFARERHKDQKRKYTGNPYTDHLAEVAGIVATVTHWDEIEPDAMIAVAWLHDVIEDQAVQSEELTEALAGESLAAIEQVTRGVRWLSDLEVGNRAERKKASRDRLQQAPGWVQTIKCADLISNASSIVQHDPKFAKVYLEEKRLLLDVLTKADARLLAIARQQIA